ncbi:uncharacterized protein LOC116632261 [Phoca vitulina]|uniref:uncharacterized protein LOC116632261 n=1 Tax=Phoca vitulina TaxID=9720 RepID=UPI0013963504|nr:uncharacterized protein LOC116632261 [Phoca vitulina]
MKIIFPRNHTKGRAIVICPCPILSPVWESWSHLSTYVLTVTALRSSTLYCNFFVPPEIILIPCMRSTSVARSGQLIQLEMIQPLHGQQKRKLRLRCVQREEPGKTQGEDSHLKAKDRGLRRHQPCPPVGLRLLAPQTDLMRSGVAIKAPTSSRCQLTLSSHVAWNKSMVSFTQPSWKGGDSLLQGRNLKKRENYLIERREKFLILS